MIQRVLLRRALAQEIGFRTAQTASFRVACVAYAGVILVATPVKSNGASSTNLVRDLGRREDHDLIVGPCDKHALVIHTAAKIPFQDSSSDKSFSAPEKHSCSQCFETIFFSFYKCTRKQHEGRTKFGHGTMLASIGCEARPKRHGFGADLALGHTWLNVAFALIAHYSDKGMLIYSTVCSRCNDIHGIILRPCIHPAEIYGSNVTHIIPEGVFCVDRRDCAFLADSRS